jgi:hypothetical protein
MYFFTRNKIGKQNNAKNIELKQKFGLNFMRNENWKEKVNGFASFEAKKFSPSFRFEAKITKSKRREKLKAKKAKK